MASNSLAMTVFSLAVNARAHHAVFRNGHIVHAAAGACGFAAC